MFAPIPLWKGKLYNALQDQGIWNVSYRKKQKFYCFFILRRHFHYDRHYDTLYTRNNINIVGYSKIWPIKERDCLNTLVSHLHNCNNPSLQVITGIEGLSLAEEEASSSQNTIQEDLNQFQTDFFTSSIIFPTPPLSQDSDPWGDPLSQNPYDYEEEPDARVYPILSSPTHVDAGIDDDAIEEYDWDRMVLRERTEAQSKLMPLEKGAAQFWRTPSQCRMIGPRHWANGATVGFACMIGGRGQSRSTRARHRTNCVPRGTGS
ncbi:hypothetical protein PIB30_050374 [Stylosanthes scabra]|uniref:Uncharacterized protein n=1 Tax=Stylosanthes scabra TaxID=79078 RepID=A0ABU6RHT2_9FABA|nr:hypothetical protein [Stylosanthes scabra]